MDENIEHFYARYLRCTVSFFFPSCSLLIMRQLCDTKCSFIIIHVSEYIDRCLDLLAVFEFEVCKLIMIELPIIIGIGIFQNPVIEVELLFETCACFLLVQNNLDFIFIIVKTDVCVFEESIFFFKENHRIT